jgi:hypothetical protein
LLASPFSPVDLALQGAKEQPALFLFLSQIRENYSKNPEQAPGSPQKYIWIFAFLGRNKGF